MLAISVDSVSKKFPRRGNEELVVLADMSISIEPGQTTAIVGPSGCGKTTLLNMIAGLDTPDSGAVTYENGSTNIAPSIGYLFQDDALLPWRSALDNALLGLECKGSLDPETIQRTQDYFSRFGLSGFEGAYPATLSGGERQRVALIQNLVFNPDILLLDEPFSSLDYQTKLILEAELMAEIRQRKDRTPKTVVFVTHDIEEAITLGDKVLVLGTPPHGVVREIEVEIPEVERDPVAARQSDQLRSIFGEIWEVMRAEGEVQ